MTDLKCPYCDGVRPTRAKLQTHVDAVHRMVDTYSQRKAAVLDARTVADIPQILCTCGEPIFLLDVQDPGSWMHTIEGPGTACLEPGPATQSTPDRRDLADRLAETGRKLAETGREVREMKAATEDVLNRLQALDMAMQAPAIVRRITLNEVWDALMDENQITAAQIVMRMIGNISEGA